jgi:hypothetical protein
MPVGALNEEPVGIIGTFPGRRFSIARALHDVLACMMIFG